MAKIALSRSGIYIIITAAIITVAGAFVWVLNTPWAYDDWYYRLMYSPDPEVVFGDWAAENTLVETFPQAVESAINHSHNNGRLTNTLHILFQPFGHGLEAVFLALWLIGMVAALVTACRRSRDPMAWGLAPVCMWIVLPWFDQFQSLVFIFGYVPPSVLLLVYIYLYSKPYEAGEPRRWRLAGYLALAFFAAWSNEGNAVGLLIYSAVVAVMQGRCRTPRRYQLLMCGALMAGLAVNIVAGTAARMNRDLELAGLNMQFFVPYVMQLWPLGVATLAVVVAKGQSRKAWLPMLTAALATATIPIFVGYNGRTLWTADLFCLVIIVNALCRMADKLPRGLKLSAAALLVVGYGAWMYGLCVWQIRIGNELRTVEAAHTLRAGMEDTTVAFGTHYGDDDIPYIYLDVVHNPLERNWGAYAMGRFLQAHPAAPMILPDSLRGLPLEKWPAVPGDNGLRGIWPMLAMADSIPTDVIIKVGPAGADMTPFDRLLAYIKGEADTASIQCFTQVLPARLPDGSTIYRYVPEALPRTIRRRPVVSVDTVSPRQRNIDR